MNWLLSDLKNFQYNFYEINSFLAQFFISVLLTRDLIKKIIDINFVTVLSLSLSECCKGVCCSSAENFGHFNKHG